MVDVCGCGQFGRVQFGRTSPNAGAFLSDRSQCWCTFVRQITMLVRFDRGTQGLVIGAGAFCLTDLNAGALLSGRSQCWCTLIGGTQIGDLEMLVWWIPRRLRGGWCGSSRE